MPNELQAFIIGLITDAIFVHIGLNQRMIGSVKGRIRWRILLKMGVSFRRAFSNIFTHASGLKSAESWVALYVRNTPMGSNTKLDSHIPAHEGQSASRAIL